MSTTISTPKILFDPATVVTRDVSMSVASGNLTLKRGQIVVFDTSEKKYQAVAITSLDFGTTLPASRCAIALEEKKLGTDAVTVKAIVAGTVFVKALRDLGYTSGKVSADALDILGGYSNIRFIEEV